MKILILILICVKTISLNPVHPESKNFKVYPNKRHEDISFWMKTGHDELKFAIDRVKHWHKDDNPNFVLPHPKNLVIFVGDGMGIPTVTAARIFKGQSKFGLSGEEAKLVWDDFPESAFLKTYNVDYQTPDSAGTATALFSGVKTTYKTLGYDSSVIFKSPSSQLKAKEVTTLLEWAQDAGMKTGFVTTSRITHATPAALYAHSASRDWECDAFMSKATGHVLTAEEDPDPEMVLDIARQMIERKPGNRTNVMFGGGVLSFKANSSSPDYVKDRWTCERKDGRDLVEHWRAEKDRMSENRSFFVTTKDELNQLNPLETDFALGLFAPSHIDYEDQLVQGESSQPNLSEMSKKAVDILKKDRKNGFFLMVEGARIDHAHHDGFSNRALQETLGMEAALESVMTSLQQTDQLDETLIIVTADHSHTMTIMGYPKRGTDIRGLTGYLAKDKLPEPILSYSNGPGYHQSEPSQNCSRQDLSSTDMFSFAYQPPATIPASRESHGGEDVGLWARGPLSYLFHKTHEQTYVAHASAFALCLGPYHKHEAGCAQRRLKVSNQSINLSAHSGIVISFVLLIVQVLN